ncbi:ribonuclease T2 family protein [Labrys neptuniae]|uniref:Ribonuclease T n=1 Tax=Labrys neptuniae TaxID=376174 RepID=A0ABV3PJ84_9HYPH
MRKSWLAALAVSTLVPFMSARAEESMKGVFTAREACPALQSIRKQTNPGDVKLTPGQDYRLLAGNKPDPTFYRVQVEDAQPAQRWVPVSCGEVKAGDNGTPATPGAGKPGPARSDAAISTGGASYVFAISWQAAFCEGLPDKTECRTQTADRYDASHFTLHGLWPQPRGNAYCGVARRDIEADKAHRWEDLPEPQLEPATRTALEKAMPGTASFLDRHEWIEHGTCFFEKSADAYFRRSVALIGEINASPVQKLFADNVGKEIDTSQIRSAFDQGFGAGAGERVRFACKRDGSRSIIVEMTIGLRGEVKDGAKLADLIAGASPTDQGCKAGIVDPVGLQ